MMSSGAAWQKTKLDSSIIKFSWATSPEDEDGDGPQNVGFIYF
jgi:hypothetical protein